MYLDPDEMELPTCLSITQTSARYKLPQTTPPLMEPFSKQCCSNACMVVLSSLIIEQAKQRFAARTNFEQNQFLLTSFEVSNTGKNKLEGQSLCTKAFKRILGISDKRYNRIY